MDNYQVEFSSTSITIDMRKNIFFFLKIVITAFDISEGSKRAGLLWIIKLQLSYFRINLDNFQKSNLGKDWQRTNVFVWRTNCWCKYLGECNDLEILSPFLVNILGWKFHVYYRKYRQCNAKNVECYRIMMIWYIYNVDHIIPYFCPPTHAARGLKYKSDFFYFCLVLSFTRSLTRGCTRLKNYFKIS